MKFRSLFCMLIACLALGACSRKAAEPMTTRAAEKGPEVAVDVSTSPAVRRPIVRFVETVGSLLPDEEVVVSSQVKGEVTEISVDVGSVVKAGQTIARISPKEYEIKLKQAEAALQQARARLGLSGDTDEIDVERVADVKQARAMLDDARLNLERAQKLLKSGDISKERLDAAENNHRMMEARYEAARDTALNGEGLVAQRRAELQLARKNLSDSTIVAPISGYVSVKHVSRGEFVAEQGGNRSVVTIVKVDPIRIQANVSEAGVAFVRQGQEAAFTVDSYPGKTFKGKVVRISPVVNSQARLLMVEGTASNPDGMLKPGMFAKISLTVSSQDPATLVPAAAVLTVFGATKVFVVENGKAVERDVTLGQRDGELVEIVKGVAEGETVALGNLDKLSNGKAVTVK